jgi:hypothetical protein
MITHSQPRSQLNQSQHPNIHSCQSCLKKQHLLATSSHLSELLTWTPRLVEQRTINQKRRLPENQVATTSSDDYYYKPHSAPKRLKRTHQRIV